MAATMQGDTRENKKNYDSDLTKRMLNLRDAELEDFAESLMHFCPEGLECQDCPLYAGFGDTFPLTPCIAIQADLELTRRNRNAQES